MATKEKKSYDIYKILRIIGFIMVGLFIFLDFLNWFQIVKVHRAWILLIIGYFLIVIELLPLSIKVFRLSNKSLTSTSVWLCLVFLSGVAITVGYVMWTNPMHWENYNPDFGGLIGGLLSGVATLIVVLFSLNTDRRRAIQKARTSAGILHEILSSMDTQTTRIQNGSKEMVFYPSNWLEYYYDITVISEYEYLKTLLMEFSYMERINKMINEGDYEKAIQLIERRKNHYMYSLMDWNPFDISTNLGNIRFGHKESLPWSEKKGNQEKVEEIKRQICKPVEKYIYDYLIENGNIDLSNIEIDLVKWIIETMDLHLVEQRLIVKALFDICCDFKESSTLVNFCWNELSIKHPKQSSN